MSDYMTDLSAYMRLGNTNPAATPKVAGFSSPQGAPNVKESSNTLDMNDFLMLIVAQFQNQSMDNTADTSDMLNQLVQMSTVQAIANITDASVMMYAGSLVGKEVTVGKFGKDGKLEEIVGVVTGTGTAGGQQVIFVNGESYFLSDIMAIGRLPDKKPEGGEGEGEGEKPPVTPPEGGDGEKPPVKPPEG